MQTTQSLEKELFVWNPKAFSNRGYWFTLKNNGWYGRPANKKEAEQLGKPQSSDSLISPSKNSKVKLHAKIIPVVSTIPTLTEPIQQTVINQTNVVGSKGETGETGAKGETGAAGRDGNAVGSKGAAGRDGMSYSEATGIRKTKLSDLITDKLVSGQGVFSSIKGGISDKIKAKAKGVKESFDPLNMARKLTGGLGAAMLGRMTGRSQEDIEHFTDRTSGKRDSSGTATMMRSGSSKGIEKAVYSKVADGKQEKLKKGEGVASVLAKLYNLIKKSHEDEVGRNELEKNFAEEKQKKKNKWNDELIEAITGIKAKGKPKTAKEEKGGILDSLKGLYDKAVKWVDEKFGWIMDLKKWLPNLSFLGGFTTLGELILSVLGSGPFLAAVGAAAAVAIAAYLSGKATEWIRENVKDMKKPTAEESANILANGSEKDIAYYNITDRNTGEVMMGGRDVLSDIIKNAKGESSWEDNAPMSEGVPQQTATQLANVPPRPDTTGGKNKSRAENWDRKFGKTHNPDGTPLVQTSAKPLPSGVEASTAAAGQGSSTAARMDPRRTDLVTPDAGVTTGGGASVGGMHGVKKVPKQMAGELPPQSNPLTERVQSAISQNNDLQIQDSGKTIVIDQSKTINAGDSGGESGGITFGGSVSVRTDDDSLRKVQRQGLRPI